MTTEVYQKSSAKGWDWTPAVDGLCNHWLQTINREKTYCIIYDHVDVARHYFLTGGSMGRRESLNDAKSRIRVFHAFPTGMSRRLMSKVANRPSYQEKFKELCPEYENSDDIELSFLVNIPG